ncbi:phosphoadenosine phosphosulfate reductase family protein [Desulfovibrio oxyclinae]|jgi:phosphoadenosine phosphosulfate reductase|uniref:phosphoadenosine phosphosulfate reductase family protein n=1 Tax=Desulfovibrio oxyclinae TaxID=63560 RepID=UPI0003693AA8|nr:phosphoadenosine phosphosulfate reductase family protein [Desulfovibrio oxyclinae]
MNCNSLPRKIERAEGLLKEQARENAAEIGVAWTGGKDSTAALLLWREVLQFLGGGPVRAICVDTGFKFPEVVRFRRELASKWNIDVHVAEPSVDIGTYPVASDPLQCCRDLKVAPLLRALSETGLKGLVTGIRRDEHPDRAARAAVERRREPDHLLINPILDWTETDVWAFHHLADIPHCELYARGYRSLGCVPCTEKAGSGGERAGRDARKERVMNELTALGYF